MAIQNKHHLQTNLFHFLILIILGIHLAACSDNKDVTEVTSQQTKPIEDPSAVIRTPLENATSISVGLSHICAIVNKEVKCWGDNQYFQLDIPELINPIAISAGDNHNCAIDEEGVKCWGTNKRKQLEIPADLGEARKVVSGSFHSCALTDDGIKCWGSNVNKQLEIPEMPKDISYLSAGTIKTCAVHSEGFNCWGDILGGNEFSPPSSVLHPDSIIYGAYHGCAITKGVTECFGRNQDQQSTVPSSLENVSQVTVGGVHTCALTTDKKVMCWGQDAYNLTKVPSLKNPKEIEASEYFTCALDDTGVVCWGDMTGFSEGFQQLQ